MTQNPFFVPRKTLLVKDVITSGATLASFHLDSGWRHDLCSGSSPVVLLRLFDYDPLLHRQDRSGMMRETAWPMQGLLRVNDITVPHLPKRKKTPPMHASYCTPPVCLGLGFSLDIWMRSWLLLSPCSWLPLPPSQLRV